MVVAGFQERLPPKIQKIQKALPALSANKEGAALVQKMQGQLKAKNFLEVEKTADAILKLMGVSALAAIPSVENNPPPPANPLSGDPTKRLTEKVERMQQGAQKWAESGRDPSAILKTMEETFKPLIEAGKVIEAEAELDRILEQLGDENPQAGDEYRGFRAPQRVTIRGYDGHAMEPFFTRDGRYLLFNNLNEPEENTNLHYAERKDDLTFEYKGEVKGVNTAALEGVPSMDKDGMFYFVSPRSYDTTFSTLHRGRFKDGSVDGVELVPGVSRKQPGIVNFDVEISADGKTLYFVDGQFTKDGPNPRTADIVFAIRDGTGFKRDPNSSDILKLVNTEALEYAADISADGLELFFTRVNLSPTTPPAIYRAARKSQDKPFGKPQKVAGPTGFVEASTLSHDGRTMYYHMLEKDRRVIYCMKR